ncbi:hypothetical protein BKA69DRAFT_1121033 [Paraphysoderma sedebokerense]|nr:hypothetical protein BKA69DRAFT_1121033 [Paraphysoderma sedebokerense]
MKLKSHGPIVTAGEPAMLPSVSRTQASPLSEHNYTENTISHVKILDKLDDNIGLIEDELTLMLKSLSQKLAKFTALTDGLSLNPQLPVSTDSASEQVRSLTEKAAELVGVCDELKHDMNMASSLSTQMDELTEIIDIAELTFTMSNQA